MRYVVILESTHRVETEALQALKAILKTLGRKHRFQCVSVKQVNEEVKKL